MCHRKPHLQIAVGDVRSRLVLSACGRPRAGDAQITIYNGQHEQTTAALVKAFEKQTGIKVDGAHAATRRHSATRSSRRARSSPADVFYTENTPVLEALREHGLLAPAAPADARCRPQPLRLRAGRCGWGSRRASRCSSTTPPDRSPRSCPARSSNWPTRSGRGKLGFAPSETDFQPLITSIVKFDGTRRRRTLAEGPDRQTASLPGQRDRRRPGQQRRERRRADQPLLLVPPARRDRRRPDALGAALLRPRRPGRPRERLGGGGAEVELAPAAARSGSSPSSSAGPGRKTIAHSDSYEYPLRAGRRPAPAGLRPFAELQPASLTPAELGDGSEALATGAEARAAVGRPDEHDRAPDPRSPAASRGRGRAGGAGRW